MASADKLRVRLVTVLAAASTARHAAAASTCSVSDFQYRYPANTTVIGPDMSEDPFNAGSLEDCVEACCVLGPAVCATAYWDHSQISGSMCHLGKGFKAGVRPGARNDTLRTASAFSRVALESPPKHPHKPGPPPPPPPPPRPAVAPPKDAKNVLLIVADDMRPDLPMYGNPIVHAPNLQRIASRGVTFNQAHVQIAYCCPSRNSFMSGRRPDTSQVWTFTTNWRGAGTTAEQKAAVFGFTDLPQWFKQNGWWTTNTGKTWHNGIGYNPEDDWSDLAEFPSKFAWPGVFYDVNNTDVSVARIKHAAALDQPFLVAHGFIKPHLPWDYPPDIKAKFYEMYANGSATVPPATNPQYPISTTPIGFHQCAEMPVESIGVPFAPSRVSALRLEYFAAISYVDEQIGRLLDALEANGVAENTAVLFLGDHGWQLGEHNMWCKMSVFDVATRIPLLISAPWLKQTHGEKTQAFAEAVDIFQTLSELAGIPVPASEMAQGKSLVPVLRAPSDPAAAVHQVALSQFPRCWQNQTAVNGGLQRCGDENNNTNVPENMCDCHYASNAGISFMGYSMRTDSPFPLRFTQWVRWNVTRPLWEEVYVTILAQVSPSIIPTPRKTFSLFRSIFSYCYSGALPDRAIAPWEGLRCKSDIVPSLGFSGRKDVRKLTIWWRFWT